MLAKIVDQAHTEQKLLCAQTCTQNCFTIIRGGRYLRSVQTILPQGSIFAHRPKLTERSFFPTFNLQMPIAYSAVLTNPSPFVIKCHEINLNGKFEKP